MKDKGKSHRMGGVMCSQDTGETADLKGTESRIKEKIDRGHCIPGKEERHDKGKRHQWTMG